MLHRCKVTEMIGKGACLVSELLAEVSTAVLEVERDLLKRLQVSMWTQYADSSVCIGCRSR